ncbi:MAG: vitamin K epoxide reductase family protein [bacterium]|jgi:uncharacterized membrane protein|nr:vitamin K epoxide reductase family protein [bacterium]
MKILKKLQLPHWIGIFSLAGVAVSLYQWLHKQGFTAGEFCNLNSTFNCDIVNKSSYSEIFGIPVALIGVIGYGFMAVAAFMKTRKPEDKTLSLFLLVASLGAFGFALYLSGIEAFVLHAWCILCLISQLTISVVMVLSVIHFKKERV